MASRSPRETIQISLGPSANAITAHLLNLQGLAATGSGFGGEDGALAAAPVCDPLTTHYVDADTSTWVPRVLMIDEATHTLPASTTTTTSVSDTASISSILGSATFVPWTGPVQVLENHHPATSISRARETASALAYSPYSRYHARRQSSGAIATSSAYRADPNSPRHVIWDDDDDHEEEEEENTRAYAQRQQQAEQNWRTNKAVSLGHELQELMDTQLALPGLVSVEEASPPTSKSVEADQQNRKHPSLRWTDIWMPPFSKKSKLVLPFSSQSQVVPHWDVTYHPSCHQNTPFLQEWKEDLLLERLRHMMEPCDYGIQGALITTEGFGIYASLATSILEELQEECKSAGRLVHHVTRETGSIDARNDVEAENFPNSTSSSWQEYQVARVRRQISSGLVLYDFTEKAHAVLPLRLKGNSGGEGIQEFRDTAQIAMALEACGLPFRFDGTSSSRAHYKGDIPYRIGLQNASFLAQGGTDTQWGNTAQRLTIEEYLSILQPSSQYSMLEMDVILQNGTEISNVNLYEYIREGTSVEQDHRMRQSGEDGYRSRPRDVEPGAWLQDISSVGSHGRGLLSSLSYSSQDSGMSLDRSIHHHFALSSSFRSMLLPSTRDRAGITMQDYLTCLVQGMGILYRPERSMATVLNQTLGELTFGDEGGGNNYGAGMYWKYILPHLDTPVVAVLGNTTRAFASLNQIATEMKTTMTAPRFRGYYNRDCLNSVLPERDDCEEALEGCWDKRDLYQPPQAAGVDIEDDFD